MSLTVKKVIKALSLKPIRYRAKLLVARSSDIEQVGQMCSQGRFQQSSNTILTIGNKEVAILNESGIWLRLGAKDQFVSLESLGEVLESQGHSKRFANFHDLEEIKRRNEGEHS